MSKLTEPHMLLDWARDLGKTYSFIDCHIHPFDVLTGDVAYQKSECFDRLFSKCGSGYHEPVVQERPELESARPSNGADTERAFLLVSRLKYMHTGSKVILDQLAAVGLSGGLLLPVARIPGKAEEMLDASQKMFTNGTNLYHACAYPIGLQTDKLFEFFRTALENYKICAVKLHLNLAAIDPLAQNGHDQIEATLEAAGALGLPVIIHGGRTSALKPCAAAEYGTVSHLETINWQLSTAPVIMAHAGCYELMEEEAGAALCRLDALFEKHPNLMADTSNLRPASLRLVLKKVCRSRLLFGSDALYIPTWEAWLRFLHALQEVSSCPDDDLVRIAALNPLDRLGLISTR